jgi:hypothetical protein
MKKTLVSMLLMLALLAFTIPAAADQKVTVGAQINISKNTPVTLQAGNPFYIAHGWRFDLSDKGVGLFDFKLEVDGVYQNVDYVDHSVIKGDPNSKAVSWVFNFPNGLNPGLHTFVGHWIGPCQSMVSIGYYPGPCPKPMEQVERSTSITVDFVP